MFLFVWFIKFKYLKKNIINILNISNSYSTYMTDMYRQHLADHTLTTYIQYNIKL